MLRWHGHLNVLYTTLQANQSFSTRLPAPTYASATVVSSYVKCFVFLHFMPIWKGVNNLPLPTYVSGYVQCFV